jgi:hypothetical protein
VFRVELPPIIRSAYNCIYSIWYLSHGYCYLSLSWKSWNRFEFAVGGVRHPQHTQTGHALAALYPQERPGTHSTGGWVGPRAGLDRCRKSRPTGIRSPNRLARSQSLYQLSYLAHNCKSDVNFQSTKGSGQIRNKMKGKAKAI